MESQLVTLVRTLFSNIPSARPCCARTRAG